MSRRPARRRGRPPTGGGQQGSPADAAPDGPSAAGSPESRATVSQPKASRARIEIKNDASTEGDLLYGRNAVHEALRGQKRRVHRIWATERTLREPWLAGGGSPVVPECASPAAIERRCGSTGHQGVCAQADPYPYTDPEGLLAGRDPFLVVLDEVQDVQNLGAICRTAECAGATGVVIPERRSAVVTPAVCKASAGAVEHLAVARIRNIADFLEAAKAKGIWCYGAASSGAVAWTQPDYSGGVALVLGAEGTGLRPRVAAACDQLIALPLRGRIDSLNVSAAAAVLVYEIVRARA
ncbi:MAG: 23S rRNA (guanosine(2251)-2'-O)-methyltransferase [uncultured Solirubrobacteraceae bacterium]|uniref:23S rRNA (Guanosine(2251)-2'-O)-methyltransferase n=1 Tax=uncultured Solirubrobacteraceae bacterium TaxID=1162706 RepID=A0A6J4SCR9_9ACTN|nr:MAG: 23S rRNA (guanosine(2251)-2'-O)-methyltransferase [uncultured Solirubrobacteraceae bacterium]